MPMTATTDQMAPVPGAPVLHGEYGAGVVRDVVRGGRALVVHFERYGAVDIQVPARELRVLPFEPAPVAAAAPADVPALAEPAQLQLLEALRLGTVPADGLDLYTVGRERELAAAEADLAECVRAGGSARVVLGDYGSGKTHLLEHIAARALAEGFVVARASLDPVDVPASHPRRVYRPLASELAYPGGETARGVLPLLERAVASDEARRRFLTEGRHLYLTPALKLFEALGADASGPLCDWLEGSPQAFTPELNEQFGLHGEDRLPALLDYRPWAHIYAHLLSGMAGMARAAGWRGLVVLLDEGELFRALNAENRAFAERLFRALMAAALPVSELPFAPASEPRGGYGPLKDLPHRWAADCPLYVALAMTPLREADDVLAGLVRPGRVTELTPLGATDYRELARKLVTLYVPRHPPLAGRVEPLSALLGELIHAGLASGRFATPRAAVKFVVELLDLSRWAPSRVPGLIDGVKRLFN
jgi:hypothetical protein